METASDSARYAGLIIYQVSAGTGAGANPAPHFLLLRKSPTPSEQWSTPQANRLPTENHLSCALRITRALTNISSEQLRIDTRFRYDLTHLDVDGHPRHVVYFLATTTTPLGVRPLSPPDGIETRMLRLDALRGGQLDANTRSMLLYAQDFVVHPEEHCAEHSEVDVIDSSSLLPSPRTPQRVVSRNSSGSSGSSNSGSGSVVTLASGTVPHRSKPDGTAGARNDGKKGAVNVSAKGGANGGANGVVNVGAKGGANGGANGGVNGGAKGGANGGAYSGEIGGATVSPRVSSLRTPPMLQSQSQLQQLTPGRTPAGSPARSVAGAGRSPLAATRHGRSPGDHGAKGSMSAEHHQGLNAIGRKNPLYKTMLCAHWQKHGTCRNGGGCGYAHGEGELQQSPFFKIKLCDQFMRTGHCDNMDSCSFAHGHDELKRWGWGNMKVAGALADGGDEHEAEYGVIDRDSHVPSSALGLQQTSRPSIVAMQAAAPPSAAAINHASSPRRHGEALAAVEKDADNSNFKTRLCRHFYLRGRCEWGATCQFAHGEHELRTRSNLSEEAIEWMVHQMREQNGPQAGEQVSPPSGVRSRGLKSSGGNGGPSPSPAAARSVPGAALGLSPMQAKARSVPRPLINTAVAAAAQASGTEMPVTPVHMSPYEVPLCQAFSLTGRCEAAGSCPFAHHVDWLPFAQQQRISAEDDHEEAVEETMMQGSVAAGVSDEDPLLFKTKLCRHFRNRGVCPVGDACQFAHGEAELRAEGSSPPRQPRQATTPARDGGAKSVPPRASSLRAGQQESHAQSRSPSRSGGSPAALHHGPTPVKAAVDGGTELLKTRLCKHFAKNMTCPLGEECGFAHGTHQLRGDRSDDFTTPTRAQERRAAPKLSISSAQLSSLQTPRAAATPELQRQTQTEPQKRHVGGQLSNSRSASFTLQQGESIAGSARRSGSGARGTDPLIVRRSGANAGNVPSLADAGQGQPSVRAEPTPAAVVAAANTPSPSCPQCVWGSGQHSMHQKMNPGILRLKSQRGRAGSVASETGSEYSEGSEGERQEMQRVVERVSELVMS